MALSTLCAVSQLTRVAVIGGYGRMGTAVSAAVEAAPDLALVARRGRPGQAGGAGDLGGAEVAVELTTPRESEPNVLAALGAGAHVVVGTSGWDGAALDRLRARLRLIPGRGVLVAPNFAIGALLLMSFAQQASRFFESVEVVETHHPDKLDAPSGTAARTATLIAAARREAGLGDLVDATVRDEGGARGARVDGIPVHSLRVRGFTASQEVVLGGPGQALTLRHDSFERASFLPGVLAGIRGVLTHPGLTVGLEHYLDIGIGAGFAAAGAGVGAGRGVPT